MKKILIISLLFLTSNLQAQLNDDFTDGNFTSNPTWTGSNGGGDFTIFDNKLRSNSSLANSSFYLSAESALATNVQWEFWVNLQFSTSGSNYLDIYVLSDKADLKASLINGYFIRIGNTDDEISLYKRSGAASSIVKIIDGANGSVGSSNNTIRIKLKRDNSGNFTLNREIVTAGSSYFSEGNAIDVSHTTSSHFGILVQQSTSSFFHKHFIDNIQVAPIITDTSPPFVSSVSNVDSNTVEILFNEPMDSIGVKTLSNYLLNSNPGAVFNVKTTNDPAKFILRFSNPLNNGTHLLTVANVKDRSGNLIGQNNYGSFNYTKPYVVKFGDVVINEIFADPTPQIDLPSVEFVELHNNSSQKLSLKDWKFSDSGSTTSFGQVEIDPQSFLIICAKADTADYKSFGRVLGLSPWPTLNNSGEILKLRTPENRIVDSVLYSDSWYRNSVKKQGGWTLERRDPLSKCESRFNWLAAIDTSGGTPGRKNSVHVEGYDSMPLFADSIKQISDTSISVKFNKHLDAATLIPANFKLIPNNYSVKKLTADMDLKTVLLTYDKKLEGGIEYQLQIFNLKDCGGKLISSQQEGLKFKTIKPTPIIEPADTVNLIISEILADPSPEVHLPLVEFIEIHNPSKDTVNLDKWTISDPTTIATIRSQRILPQEFIIFCPIADTVQYKPFGRTIGLSPWPSLNNAADQLSLKSFKNRTVDSIAYSDAWYKNTLKKTGGWSLEKVDLKSVCDNFFNWTASTDTNGGTPGKPNSVNISNYDGIVLKADSIKLTSDTTVKLYFNKHLNSATLIPHNFKLNPENAVKNIVYDTESREVTITCYKKFEPGTNYQMSVSSIKDCSGNLIIQQTPLSFKTKQPQPPVFEKPDTVMLVISEIFADPSPEVHLPLVEFIEIHNPSKDTVNLDNWTLCDPATIATIRGQKILPQEFIIFCPIADTVQYKPYGKTIGLNPWPSLNNNSDQIVLRSSKNRLVDSVAYSDIWHRNNNKKAGGWSIEKIDLKSICEDFFNWTAATDTNGGTPGKRNSVSILAYDGIPLRIDSSNVMSDSTLKLTFNKHLNTATLVAENFNLTPANGKLKRITTDNYAKEVTLTYDKKFPVSSEFQLSLSNLKDCSGNLIGNHAVLKFRTAPPPAEIPIPIDTAMVLITEIFADPSPEVNLPLVEFVEIYNPSKDTVDLDKWTINDPTTKAVIRTQKILPGEYVILCPMADTIHYKPYGKTIGLNPWPSLNNAADQISLKSYKNRLVDSMAYSDTWYRNRTKKNGGWSMERINLRDNNCVGFYNWVSSTDESGGTPGRINSENIISKIPEVVIDSLRNSSDSTITIYLSSLPDTSYLKPASFAISNEIGKASSLLIEDDYMTIHLKFTSKFQPGISYVLTAESLFNCKGEKTQPPKNQVSFTIPIVPELDYPILINEILADPSPQIGLPETEFVELYNPTERTVSLKGMSYGDESLQHRFTHGDIPAKSYLILSPEKDTLNFVAFGRVMGIPNWPALANEKDVLILKNNKGRELQRVAYNTSWYKNAVKKTGGYSLEMINHASICKDSQNWAASSDPSGGTPGRENSVHSNTAAEGLKLLNIVLTDSLTLLLSFNKAVDSLSASFPTNYVLNNGAGNPESVMPIAPVFEKVLLKLRAPLTRGHAYKVQASDLRDCAGSTILVVSSSQEFFLAEKIVKEAILVNEILFNPRSGGVDFVEIYNNTKHPLDLKDLSIANAVKDTVSNAKPISINQLLFKPGQYMAITSDPEIVKKEYITENPDNFLKVPLPQFNDDKGTVVLMSNGHRIDQLDYTDKMHFPLLKTTEGVSLERTTFNMKANETGNFRSATAAAGHATPGYKNSQYSEVIIADEEFNLISRTFSPDNDGFEDQLQVSYKTSFPGMVANVKIFNDKGVLIKNLVKNSTLNTSGMLIWDGLDEFNTPAIAGVYIVYADIFDTNGNFKRFRKSFALATKL